MRACGDNAGHPWGGDHHRGWQRGIAQQLLQMRGHQPHALLCVIASQQMGTDDQSVGKQVSVAAPWRTPQPALTALVSVHSDSSPFITPGATLTSGNPWPSNLHIHVLALQCLSLTLS